MQILVELGDKQNIPSVLVNMGQVYEKTGHYDSAVYYYQQAIPLCQVPGMEKELSSAYGNLGLVYKIKGNYQVALENYSKALKISTTIGDKEFMATDLNNIAAVYVQWENFAMAKAYFRKALDIYQQNGSPDKVEVSLANLGTLYQKEGKCDSALLFFRASLAIARKLERVGSIAVKLSNMGVIFYELGNLDSAIVYQSEALKISRNIGRMFPVCAAIQNLGEIYLAKHDLNTARKYLEEAQRCAESIQAKTILEKVFKSLSQLYEKMGDPAKALTNYKRYTALKDSMFTLKSQEKFAEMEARYQSEKKQQHIELLIKDQELKEASLKKQRLALYWVISGSLILLVSLAVISFLLKQKSKANRILVEKNMQLLQHEESNGIQAGINASPSISDDEKSRLIAGLNKLIRHDKIFTRPQISLADLAEHLGTNTTYLSRIINEDFQHNFPNFINRMRIQEAQKMFVDHKYKSMTLEGIAGSVGFHSRSTFNLAFKKFTGVTPSVYIANLEKLTKPA